MTVLLEFIFRMQFGQVFATIFIFIAIYYTGRCLLAYYHHMGKIKQLVKLPGMPGHPLLGGLAEFPGPGEDGLKFLRDRTMNYPKLTYMRYGFFHVTVAINHAEPVKYILKTSEPKPRQFGGYKNALPWLGEGLLIAEGKKWARNRRLLTPAFHFDILKPYIAVNNDAANVLIEKIDTISHQNDKYFEVFGLISLCTLEIILKCAFSYSDDVQRLGEGHPYVKAVLELSHTLVYRFLRPWLYPDFTFYLSSVGRRFRKNCNYVHDVADDIIEKRRQALSVKQTTQCAEQKRKYLDFLDILLTAKDENGVGLTHQEIRNEVDTFLFEGHDTTASGISWTLYALAENLEWQKKCQEEIDQILDRRDSDVIFWDDMSKLTTLTLCIKEALRLHTPVPFIQRCSTKDMYIDGYFIPSGTEIDILLYNILHNPYIWDKPMVFDPERFRQEKDTTIDSFAFIPFSAGPRNCIGQHFAMHEMKIIIARLLRRFTFDVDPLRPAEHEIIVVMKTEKGMYLRATPKNTKR